MAQTWDVTLFVTPTAQGYGNTISEGYGSVGGQWWDVTLFDGAASGYGNTISGAFDDGVEGVGETVWYGLEVTVLAEGATRPFHAPLDLAGVFAPLDVVHVLAPLDAGPVFAPLDVNPVFAPLDMETEV